MCLSWPSLPFPLPPVTWLVYGEWEPPPPLGFGGYVGLFKLSPEHCFISTQIAVTWTCDQLDWGFSLIIIIFINTNSPFIRNPQERVFWSPKQHHSESINIIYVPYITKFVPFSNLAYSFRRPITTIVASRDRENQFLRAWKAVARHLLL
jgi:hypothetical protein